MCYLGGVSSGFSSLVTASLHGKTHFFPRVSDVKVISMALLTSKERIGGLTEILELAHENVGDLILASGSISRLV